MNLRLTEVSHKQIQERLIELPPSTEIFSKRRKIYAFWREARATCYGAVKINFSLPEHT